MRYRFWNNNSLTKESRERADTQVIGTANSKRIEKDKVILRLAEYSGPGDDQNPNDPATFQIPLRQILTAQRALWQYGQKAFHDSIGKFSAA